MGMHSTVPCIKERAKETVIVPGLQRIALVCVYGNGEARFVVCVRLSPAGWERASSLSLFPSFSLRRIGPFGALRGLRPLRASRAKVRTYGSLPIFFLVVVHGASNREKKKRSRGGECGGGSGDQIKKSNEAFLTLGLERAGCRSREGRVEGREGVVVRGNVDQQQQGPKLICT